MYIYIMLLEKWSKIIASNDVKPFYSFPSMTSVTSGPLPQKYKHKHKHLIIKNKKKTIMSIFYLIFKFFLFFSLLIIIIKYLSIYAYNKIIKTTTTFFPCL